MKILFRNALVILALSVLGAWLWQGWEMAVSILFGGSVAVINFLWMTTGVDRLLGRTPRPDSTLVIIKYVARLLLLLGTFFVIIHTSFLSLLGALIGLSVFVLSGLVEAIKVLVRTD